MRYIFGIVALAAAIYFIIKTMQKKREIHACNGLTVDATIVGHDMATLSAGTVCYYPICEYVVEGETLQYTSKIPLTKQIDIGTTIKLSYNAQEKKVVDSMSITAETTLAVVLGGIAFILLAV